MRMLLSAFLLVLVNLNATGVAAQSDLDEVDVKLKRVVESNLPGWKHKRVEPIAGSKNVLVLFWSNSNRVVKISVVPHKSAQDARNAIQDFMKSESKEEIRGLGDEAYTWGYGLGNVAFRKGRLNIYVSTMADVNGDADALNLTALEKNERMRSEMRRWSREFAKHAANALDIP